MQCRASASVQEVCGPDEGAPPIPRQKWRANVSVMHAPCAPDVVGRQICESITQSTGPPVPHTRYEVERMPSRHSTARVYRSFLNDHILPKWGDTEIRAVQPRPVELWLPALPLSPKSKTHVRSLMHGLVEFAMWAGLLDISRNPISLVQNTGATRRVRKARSLTAEQFQALLKELLEPFATMALLCVCLGLRTSEALRSDGLTWIG